MMLPEWAPQWGVMITWPHAVTDWRDMLPEVEQTYCAMAHAILADENLLIICRDVAHEQHIRALLARNQQAENTGNPRLHFHRMSYNDTWVRDYGPIAVDGKLLDFTFNGWGNKFASKLDNAVNRRMTWAWQLQREKLILEGGGLETDGKGCLLTTRTCLENPNRSHKNQPRPSGLLEKSLSRSLGFTDYVWLTHGHLEGDDTDAHIDTLARFLNENTVTYVQCTDVDDSHHASLSAMEQELQAAAKPRNWTLVPLPMTPAIHDEDGERLPATYANFLITNHSILVPTYGVSTDQSALSIISQHAGQRRVVGIDCQSLIRQHGSLHCATMQLPEGCRVVQ